MSKIKALYKVFASMTTGLILLVLIGISSAIGTSLMPDHFFHTSPFLILLALLFINMGLCTFNQLSRFIKSLNSGPLKKRLWSKSFSLLILHLGIVLILSGAAINIYQGQSVQARIIEGNTININELITTSHTFSLKLDKFILEYYGDGSPSQYYSQVSVMEGQNKIKDYSISVNYPLKFQGIKAYQHSYGHVVELLSQDGEAETDQIAGEGQSLIFQHSDRIVKLYKYIPNYDSRYGMNTKTIRPDNPKIVYSVYEHDHLLGIGAADFGEAVMIDEEVFITFEKVIPYTVLTIKHDPGLILTSLGGIMLMIGVCLIFYFVLKKKQLREKKEGNEGNGANDVS